MAIYTNEWLEVSKQRAVQNGYEPFEDPEAYGGEVFVKEDRKWIHSIGRLKYKLGVAADEELESLGYSVSDYYLYNSDEKEFSQNTALKSVSVKLNAINVEMLKIFDDNSIDYPNGLISLSDGMYINIDGNIIGDWNR